MAPYLAPFRGHSRRVWLLWAIGAVVLISLAELDPSVLVYVYDPELLAGVVAFSAVFVNRRSKEVMALVGAAYLEATHRVSRRLPASTLPTRVWLQAF